MFFRLRLCRKANRIQVAAKSTNEIFITSSLSVCPRLGVHLQVSRRADASILYDAPAAAAQVPGIFLRADWRESGGTICWKQS
jgi:hypothetical protein